jgi:type III restriction enzyme
MNKDSDATGPRVVEIDQENLKKDLDSLDIQIPVLSPKLKKEYKRLDELDLKSLDFKPLIMKKFSEEQLREIVFGEIVEGKEHHRTLLKNDAPADWRFVIKFFTERILKELRLFKGYDTLYPLVKEFCAEMIFGKSVNLEEEIILKNLSEIEARRTIEETFKKAINSLTIHESGETEVRDTISVRKTRPFVINDSEFYRPNKSVFNIISGDSILELRFAALLDNCADVVSFGKNYFAVNFKLDYLNADGVISYYYPDFLVKLKPSQGKEELYVVETKGREDLDDPLKFSRLEQWIKDVNSIPGAKQIWNALYVSQETFDKNRGDYRSFADLVAEFKDSRPKVSNPA